MSLRLRNVQVDVLADVYEATRAFWAGALGASGTREANGPYTHLVGPRSSVGVHLQRLEEGVARMHLDLGASDPQETVAHLTAIGASRVAEGAGGPVLRDPAGLLLCVCAWGDDEELDVAPSEAARLTRVVLDVPSSHHAAALAFWADVFDTVPRTFDAPFDAFAMIPGAAAPGGTIDLLVQDVGDGAAGIHVDLHVPDTGARDAEVDRLVGLGASVHARHQHWVVLHDPAGLPLCVVPDEA